MHAAGPDGILARVQELAGGVEHLAPIERWLHAAPAAVAAQIGNIG